MKCPNCKFVSSNTRDICPRCDYDLRPHKQALGLPVTNTNPIPPKKVEVISTTQEPVIEIPKTSPPTYNPMMSTASEPTAQHVEIEDQDLSLTDLENQLSLSFSEPSLVTEVSGLHSVESSAPDIEDVDIKALFELDELDLEEDTPALSLDTENEISQDPIKNYTTSIQENLSQATLATSALTTLSYTEETEAPIEENKNFQSPTVAPSIVDLSEDDSLLDEALNEMLGDTVFDVEAVKTVKPSTSVTPSTQTLTEDDIEITFEVEMEDEDEVKVEETKEEEKTPSLDDDFLSGLTDALNTIEAQSKQITVSPQTNTQADSFVSALENDLKLSSSPTTAPPDPKEFLAKLTAAEASKPEVFNQLMSMLKQAYGVNSETTPPADITALSTIDPNILRSLESELDQELKALLGDGTSFVQTSELEPPAEIEPASEPISEISQLQDELSSELEMLSEEGITLAQNPSESGPEETTKIETIFEAEEDLSAELLALEQEVLIVENEKTEEFAEALSSQLTSTSNPEQEETDITSLWNNLDTELIDNDLTSLDQELSFSDLANIEPNETLNLLFDLTDEDLSSPGEKKEYIESIPDSSTVKVDNLDLGMALKNFDKDVIKAEKTRSHIQKLRDSGVIDRREIEEKLKTLTKGGLVRRSCGFIIDLIYNAIVALGLTYLLYLPQSTKDALLTQQSITIDDLVPHTFAFIGFLYATWIILSVLLVVGRGQTVGQKWLGLEVVNLRGEPLGLGQAIVRTLLQTTTLFTLGLGVLPILSKNKQALHDSLSRTIVKRV